MPYGSTIVCGIDESAASVHACQQVIGLPGKRTEVIAVAVQPPVPMAWDPGASGMEQLDRELADRRKQLEANLENLSNSCCGELKVQTRLETEGQPHERIVQIASEKSADLIVLGARKAVGAIPHRMLGAVASRVIGFSECDVLLVPEGVDLHSAGLLVSVDGSDHCKRAMTRGIAIASEYGMDITFLSVAAVPEGVQDYSLNQLSVDRLEERARTVAEEAVEFAAASGVAAKSMVRTGPPAQKIVAVAKELDVSLILMGSHGRTGLKRLLMGSTTERVLQLSPCPVLVTRIC